MRIKGKTKKIVTKIGHKPFIYSLKFEDLTSKSN